jgi:DNA repair exonuclease SbcCD ATPase subunit
MFFARRKPEAVSADKLAQFLDLQFEKKLGPLGSKSNAITDSLNQTMRRFGDACDRFGQLDAEPHIEGRYLASANSIKTQKSRYAGSLKHILGSASLEAGDAINSYDRYRRILSNLEGMIKKVLETNANFKTVLYCYSNYLWDFKSLFSEIERLAGALKSEIDNRSEDFSEYGAVGEHVSRLNRYREELEALNKSVQSLKTDAKSGDENAPDKNGTDISMKLGDKKAELARLNKERSALRSKINSLILPLERASKKLDHLSASKAKLHAFVEDPISAINNEREYGEFMALVRELDEKIRTGAIDLKNSDRVGETASMLLGSDIYSMICSFRSNQQKELEIGREVEALEKGLNEIKRERTDSERHMQEITRMEGRLHEIEKSMEAEKSTIEKLFLDHYGVLISVTLTP